MTTSAIPVKGILEDGYAIGITTDVIGIAKLSLFNAMWESAKLTASLTGMIAVGLFTFVVGVFDF